MKPKEKWQAEVIREMNLLGYGYKELAEKIGLNEGSVRHAMSKKNLPGVREKICKHFGIELEE